MCGRLSLCICVCGKGLCLTRGSWLQVGLRLTTHSGVVGLVEHAFDALFGSIEFGLDTTEFALTQVEPGGEGECL